MKPFFTIVFLLVQLLTTANLYAQKITIDELENAKTSTFDGGEEIKLSDFQKNDFIIAVDKRLKITDFRFLAADGKFTSIKISTVVEAIDGFDQYVITRMKDADMPSLKIQLVTGKGKTEKVFNYEIVLKKDVHINGDGEDSEIPPCKLEALKKIHYRFIPDNIFNAILDSCKYVCDTCPENKNTVIYDFATNETDYRNRIQHKRKNSLMMVKVGDPIVFKIKNVNPLLYDVTMSDSLVSRVPEATGLLGLLTAGNAIKALSGNVSEVIANSTVEKDDECEPSASDSIGKGIVNLMRDMSKFYARLQELHPYYDANCLRRLIQAMRDSVDVNIEHSFGEYDIRSFYDLIFYVKDNAGEFKDSLAEGMEAVYNKITKVHYGYVYKVQHVENVNAIDFIFSIKPKNQAMALPRVEGSSIRVHTWGGMQWEVSSGLYYAFNMQNDQFSIRGDSNVIANSNGIVDSVINRRGVLYKESKTGRGEFGFSSFYHVYPRWFPGFNISGNIGAGVSFKEKPQIRYFLGAGFLFGRDSKLALNVGGIFGNVNELSDQYQREPNGEYRWLSPGEAGKDPLFKKRFVARGFLSLSYTLSFINRNSKKQEVEAAGGADPAPEEEEKPENGKPGS